MRKIRNIIWTCYSRGFRRKRPRRQKICKKFIEICNAKFNKLITLQKFHDFLHGFGQKYKTNWKCSPQRGFRGGGELQDARELLLVFLSFPLATLIFSSTFVFRPRRVKLIIYYSVCKGVQGAKTPSSRENSKFLQKNRNIPMRI